jgi:VRR-NUC domain
LPRPAATLDPHARPLRRRKTARNPEPSEDAITAAVLEHWRLLGVPGSLVASIPNKRAFGQAGLTPGLPDLIVLSPQLGRFTGYIELKRARRGRLSVAQKDLRAFLLERGVPYAVCCGRDEPIAKLEEWGAVRKTRATE